MSAADPSPPPSPDSQRKNPIGALKPLVPYALKYRTRIFLALVALTVAAGATLTVPAAVRSMIDHGFTSDAGKIDRYFLAMGAVALTLALASASRYYLVMTLGERIVADLRAALFAHLARLDAAFFDGARTGELVSRLTSDTTQLKAAFGSSASVALRNLFMFVGAIVLMVLTSPKLSGLVLTAIPLIVLPLVASGRGVRRRSRLAQDRLADATSYASENLGAARTMQAYGAEEETTRRFEVASDEAYNAAQAAISARAILTFVAIFLSFASVIGVLWWGARDVMAGRMTGGQLSQFLIYAVLGASSLGELSQVWTEVTAAAGAAGRIGELLAIQPKIFAPAHPAHLPKPTRGAIQFDHVRFSYPGAPLAGVLTDFDVKIQPGERVAIVGPSGAGKSTTFQLLMRFYDPIKGRITIDDTEIATLDPRELRKQIALVPQEPTIFACTIAQNIAYGQTASRERIEQAARRAAAHSFISEMPQGYDTMLGERGVNLSGGQRQRLAIARAILKNAPILLLDEATSALDSHNESLVQQALEDVMVGRTSLAIAHRLSTILKADRILVMQDGKIVEQGTHQELSARNGVYAELAKLQFDVGRAVLADSCIEQ